MPTVGLQNSLILLQRVAGTAVGFLVVAPALGAHLITDPAFVALDSGPTLDFTCRGDLMSASELAEKSAIMLAAPNRNTSFTRAAAVFGGNR